MRSLAVALVLLWAAPAAALPELGGRGPYPVGLTNLVFTKASETTGEPRRLDTAVWYPAVEDTGTPEWDVARDAEVRRGRWPLVVFSHGACGFPGQSPFYTAGLASWGFVVAAPPHPGNTTAEIAHCFEPAAFADSYANRPADVRFVIDAIAAESRRRGSPFLRRVNRRRVGVSGHSFGGQTTLRVAAEEPRIRGAVALAPASMRPDAASIRTPTMILAGERDSITPYDTAARGAYALLEGPRFLVQIRNTGHCGFAILCAPLFCGAGCEPEALPLDQAHALTLRYAVPFFLRYVGGRHRFARALLPDAAPGDVVVEEAHPRGGPR